MMCFPINKTFFCAVKGFSDAHILLSPCDGCGKGYEIVIGGWNNKRSVIREDVHYPWPGYADTNVSSVFGCESSPKSRNVPLLVFVN